MATSKDIKIQTSASSVEAKDVKTKNTEKRKNGKNTITTAKAKPKVKAIPKTKKEEKKTIELDRKKFEEVLKVALGFTNKGGALPVLQHVHVEKTGDTLRITATDLNNTWITKIPSKGEDVKKCIPLNTLYQEVKALQSSIDKVKLTFINDQVSVNNRCEIFTMGSDEFPKINEQVKGKTYQIPGLAESMKKVIRACSQEDTRYTLQGVLVDFNAGNIVATDGHRLHHVPFKSSAKAKSILISKSAVEQIVKHSAPDNLAVCDGEPLISISLAGGTMISRLIDGNFPDYQNIVSTLKNPIKVTFISADFLKILEGAIPLAGESKAVVLKLNKKLSVYSMNHNLGSYEWTLDAEIKGGKPEDLKISFNSQYLIDAIKSFPAEKSVIEIKEPLTPCIVNKQAVVMPVRV